MEPARLPSSTASAGFTGHRPDTSCSTDRSWFGSLAGSDRETGHRAQLDILTALALDYQVPNSQISVSVNSGNAVLSGQVEWNYQREAAFEDAFMIYGVKDVANLIGLSQPEVFASDVQARIAAAFARNAELYDDNITVIVPGSPGTLDGTVETFSERDLAEDTAWMAPGVNNVVDNIDILAP